MVRMYRLEALHDPAKPAVGYSLVFQSSPHIPSRSEGLHTGLTLATTCVATRTGKMDGRVDQVHRAIGLFSRAQTMVLWTGSQLRRQWAIYRERFSKLKPAQKAGVVAAIILQPILLIHLLRKGGGELMHGA